MALAPSLVERGVLTGCHAGPIRAGELREATELLALGGGCVAP